MSKTREARERAQAAALMCLKRHPDFKLAEIARAIGIHRSTIYKPPWAEFRMTYARLQGLTDAPPTGFSNGSSGQLEAWDDSRATRRRRSPRNLADD